MEVGDFEANRRQVDRWWVKDAGSRQSFDRAVPRKNSIRELELEEISDVWMVSIA